MVSGGDQEQGGGVGADAVQGKEAGRAGGHERDDQLIEAVELAVEECRAAAQLAQRDPGGVADDITGAWPQRGQPGHQPAGSVAGEPDPDIVGAGQD